MDAVTRNTRTRGEDVPAGAGHPRLVKSNDGHVIRASLAATGVETTYLLDSDRITMGSRQDQDVQAVGAEPAHGHIRREPDGDEYIYEQLSYAGDSQLNGKVVATGSLHHGDRLTVGQSTFIFQRDEFADHGRFDGGRQGGEASGSKATRNGGHEDEIGEAATIVPRPTRGEL